MSIAENYRRIRKEIPEHVSIVVAAKTRTAEELSEIIDAGATDIGENYVQEAESAHQQLGEKANRVRWHLIGPLQKNKINKALPIFDIFKCPSGPLTRWRKPARSGDLAGTEKRNISLLFGWGFNPRPNQELNFSLISPYILSSKKSLAYPSFSS